MSKHSSRPLFSLDDYRPYVRAWGESRGRGEFRKIADALRMHSTLVSQVLSGRKCFTIEQASQLCRYMGLDQLETDYLLKLVQLERAGTEDLKIIYLRHLKELREQAKEVKNRVSKAKEITEQDQAVFYSSLQYGLIRLLTSMERFQTPEEISLKLQISASRVREILRFLTSRGLCKMDENGRFSRTEKNTHVEARSPLAIRHHQNWRGRSIELLERMTSDDLSFTAPIALSRKDIPRIRAVLLDAISNISKIVEGSSSEEVVYLGIDWVKM